MKKIYLTIAAASLLASNYGNAEEVMFHCPEPSEYTIKTTRDGLTYKEHFDYTKLHSVRIMHSGGKVVMCTYSTNITQNGKPVYNTLVADIPMKYSFKTCHFYDQTKACIATGGAEDCAFTCEKEYEQSQKEHS